MQQQVLLTIQPRAMWTRVCLFGPHRSSDELSHLSKQSRLSQKIMSGPFKVDQTVLKGPEDHVAVKGADTSNKNRDF